MSADFQYDVFLSHNQADKPRVRRLAERLRAAGLRVWFDEWTIQASRTLACPAEAFRRRRKRSTVLFRDPDNAGRRFIPLNEALAASA